MRITACVGDYAEKPYSVPGVDLPVYCAEELCYCLKENAFLMDASLMCESIVKWLDKQCGLRDLADDLTRLMRQKGSLSAFVLTILQYVGLYDGSAMREVEQLLRMGAGLSQLEKRKKQVDFLLHKKNYHAAIIGYLELIGLWEEKEKSGESLPAIQCLADIWHNLSVARAGVMEFERASEGFLKAYILNQDRDDAFCYGAAKKLSMPRREYELFYEEKGHLYYDEYELNSRLQNLLLEWEQSSEASLLKRIRELYEDGESEKFVAEAGRILGRMRENYRNGTISID